MLSDMQLMTVAVPFVGASIADGKHACGHQARDRQLYHLRHTRDYEALGIPIGASKADAKAAYRQLAKVRNETGSCQLFACRCASDASRLPGANVGMQLDALHVCHWTSKGAVVPCLESSCWDGYIQHRLNMTTDRASRRASGLVTARNTGMLSMVHLK